MPLISSASVLSLSDRMWSHSRATELNVMKVEPMRVLIVTGHFSGEGLNPWLLDDLATAFSDAGDEVDVLVHDTKNPRAIGRNEYADSRIRLLSVGPSKIRAGSAGKLLNNVAAGWGLHNLGFRLVHDSVYDLCVYTSIGAFSWGLPARLRRKGIARRSVFVLWDFFPIHQIEIGRIRVKFLHAPMRALEARSIRNADVIAVMSPANERFLRRYHPNLKAKTIVIPPWASDALNPETFRSTPKLERFTVLFGGQLVAGRGVDVLLRAWLRIQIEGRDVDLIIAGDGPARTELMLLAERIGLTNVRFVGALPRDEYRALLRSAHVGVAITVAGVTPPSFPSKIVEYCASGVPVVVCVEPASDAGTIIEAAGAGLAAAAGDVAGLAQALDALFEEHKTGTLEVRARNARLFFEEELSVTRAVGRFHAAANCR
ncbi:glycosyltransferase family 4 protein [Cryobacterium cryoconiti]|uniref:Glycosyltransferase n=1 Tax=Cryobacterium cryoconiti TaxID=1259239 RepID=A0A4Y8JX04_9MICO|nr:glycosyltransferase family 4 protein [Cryobacterium cryoconiti]TFD30221.1 glycosyltransferase [Cryobacterium cryoconiti]